MIIVLGIIEVDAGDRQRYLEEKAPQEVATRDEAGCIEYVFSAEAGDPGRVRLVERWETMADLEAHLAGLRAGPGPDRPPVPSRMVAIDVLEAEVITPPWA
jgi:quinol monooxygenase YgiN